MIFSKLTYASARLSTCRNFPKAGNPAFKLWADFDADISTRKTSAQITKFYSREDLIDRQVAAMVNFSPKQVGKFI